MKLSSSLRCLAIALVLARSGITSEAAVPASECVHTWQRWEHALTSTRPCENPYANVILRVTYTGPDQRTLRLPDNDAIEVDLSQFPAPLSGRWFDPVRGQYTPLPDRIANQGIHRFTPPAKGDWVLLLERSTK